MLIASVRPQNFVVYGPSHLAALAVAALGIVVVLVTARFARRRVDRIFAVAIIAVALPMQVIQFIPPEWSFRSSLPLQLCDLAWMVAAVALWTRWRLAATMTYLWGLTLTTQAMLTPALTTPFPGLRWWMFWAMHSMIVWAAVYVVWAMKLPPTWKTYRQTVGITFAWAVTIIIFNFTFGTNYGYLNGKPANRSALDLLGPWPLYVVFEIAAIAAAWALLTLPWTRKARSEALVLS